MSSVLVLAEHPEIEALLADLVLFAGYHPAFVRADETAVDALRRRAIDILLIDAATPPITRCACEDTARERVTGVVYFASTMNAAELRAFAEVRDATHFALPNGPKVLRAVLDDAMRALGRATGPAMPVPGEIIAAVHAVAHARRIGSSARTVVDENHRLRAERDELLASARAGRDMLRDAVLEYLHTLQRDGLPRERALELVDTAVRESAEAIGAPELLVTLEREAAEWVDEIYRVA